jgi:hypothetical protein
MGGDVLQEFAVISCRIEEMLKGVCEPAKTLIKCHFLEGIPDAGKMVKLKRVETCCQRM